MLQPGLKEDTSDSSDEDYVPEDTVVSEEEASGDDENLDKDPEPAEDGAKPKRKTSRMTKTKTKTQQMKQTRRRRGGIRLHGDDESNEEDEEKPDLVKEFQEELREKKEENEKKRVDDLWADFMKDVGPTGKSTPADTASSSAKKPAESTRLVSSYSAIRKPEKVTVTKVFDFAGETVKVTKEVEADSKEAKAMKKESVQTSCVPQLPSTGIKRPGGGLGSVLSKISKKPRMSTLDKSKLDWESFKDEEGIHEELQIHNRGRDGFIERKNFLERTDLRQFEIERDIRQANSSSKR